MATKPYSVTAVRGATTDLVALLEQAGPYGSKHREPRFAFAEATLVKADIVGEKHVSCILSSKDGGRLKAIAFRAMDNEMGPGLLAAHKGGKKVHIAGHLTTEYS